MILQSSLFRICHTFYNHGGLERSRKQNVIILGFQGETIVLKAEQEKALYSLLEGNDVLAVLPTGFGKTMIFTMFSVAARERTLQAPVSVLKNAAELKADNLNAILKDPPHFIYASAEKALEERFLRTLKDFSSELHKRISLIDIFVNYRSPRSSAWRIFQNGGQDSELRVFSPKKNSNAYK